MAGNGGKHVSRNEKCVEKQLDRCADSYIYINIYVTDRYKYMNIQALFHCNIEQYIRDIMFR